MIAKQLVLLCKVALLQCLEVLSFIPKQLVLLFWHTRGLTPCPYRWSRLPLCSHQQIFSRDMSYRRWRRTRDATHPVHHRRCPPFLLRTSSHAQPAHQHHDRCLHSLHCNHTLGFAYIYFRPLSISISFMERSKTVFYNYPILLFKYSQYRVYSFPYFGCCTCKAKFFGCKCGNLIQG